jgi:uncharacterized protein YbbK (DUF523 family)
LKKKVAISACLVGQVVRYDGLSKYHQVIMDYLAESIELIPVCPEVAIGLPVPREKIQLYIDASMIAVKQISNQDIDYTAQLSAYARQFMSLNPDLSAIILKSRSPSCGLMSTPIFQYSKEFLYSKGYQQDQGKEIKQGSGQFAYIIKTEYPSVTLIEETELATLHQCNDFFSNLA